MTRRSEIEDSVDALMFAIEEASAVQTKHGAADPSAEDEKSAVLAHVDALLDELRRVEGERERHKMLATLLFARLALTGTVVGMLNKDRGKLIQKHIDEIAEVREQFPEIDSMVLRHEDQGYLDALMELIMETRPESTATDAENETDMAMELRELYDAPKAAP